MTDSTRHLVYKMHYREHLAPSQIDRRLHLRCGTAQKEIAASWLLEMEEIQAIVKGR